MHIFTHLIFLFHSPACVPSHSQFCRLPTENDKLISSSNTDKAAPPSYSQTTASAPALQLQGGAWRGYYRQYGRQHALCDIHLLTGDNTSGVATNGMQMQTLRGKGTEC